MKSDTSLDLIVPMLPGGENGYAWRWGLISNGDGIEGQIRVGIAFDEITLAMKTMTRTDLR
jgi:hypothetical protein